MNTFGIQVRKERKRRNLKIAALAEMVGVCEDTIERIESGSMHVKLTTAVAVIIALDLSPDVIMPRKMHHEA